MSRQPWFLLAGLGGFTLLTGLLSIPLFDHAGPTLRRMVFDRNGVFENATVILYLLTAGYACKGWAVSGAKRFAFAGLFSLFMIGEEMRWGLRLAGREPGDIMGVQDYLYRLWPGVGVEVFLIVCGGVAVLGVLFLLCRSGGAFVFAAGYVVVLAAAMLLDAGVWGKHIAWRLEECLEMNAALFLFAGVYYQIYCNYRK